ncbi:hypothetical protein B6N60_04396 [Richelia sinica FACHB-800]|uniref:Uncharacterized protein n=1 Tax=Richelia sinica FACHB-800 TaxID=1357546 RepID=A0A975TD23_9NOST|nr:hypothetical protein B6N60_04396 [Richelia sinica FACHB-800]
MLVNINIQIWKVEPQKLIQIFVLQLSRFVCEGIHSTAIIS